MTQTALQTPCQRRDPDMWFSPNVFVKQRAGEICKTECPLVNECFALAKKNNEIHGVWGGVDFTTGGFQSNSPSARGLCRNGKHDLPEGGPCKACQKEGRKARTARQKGTYSLKPRKYIRKNYVGGKCKLGHDLTEDNVSIRSYDQAVMCNACKRINRPHHFPSSGPVRTLR